MYVAILVSIWWDAGRAHVFAAVPIAAALVSQAWHGERPAVLGLRFRNFGVCTAKFGPGLLALTAIALALGWVLGTIQAARVRDTMQYLLWALLQQYALNGYFVNRFVTATGTPARAVALAALCFAGVHVPNPLLMGVALIGGYLAARAYLACRNLLFLGAAHALVGTLIAIVVPASISHGMVVGPSCR